MNRRGGAAATTATLHRGQAAGAALVQDAAALAAAAYEMTARFHRGGKLLAFGDGGPGTDASHVAVEFMHPVIVGKPALPALALDPAGATGPGGYAHQLRQFADPADIVLAFAADGDSPPVVAGLRCAEELDLLRIALVGGDGGVIGRDKLAQHVFVAADRAPGVVKEIHVTMYHLLWELVHVLLQQPQWGFA
jgi:D-sedoheptulose 7-phosphate isomerase